MTLLKVQSLVLCAAMTVCAGTSRAAIYGMVDSGRVSVIISDQPPADSRYILFKKNRPGAIVELAGDAPTAAPRIVQSQYRKQILAAAKATSVDEELIRAVISVESGYNPSALSSAGAVGLMQLMPGTARRYGVTDSLDPAQNIHAGARYLRDLKVMFGNDLQLVLAAYNAGENAVVKYGGRIPPFRETAAYVPKVLDYYRRLLPAAPRAPAG